MLQQTLHILSDIILPVFLLIGVGAALDRTGKLDLPTLSRLNFYVFVPALVFVKTVDSPLSLRDLGLIGLFTVLHAGILFAIGWFAFRRGMTKESAPVFIMGSAFYNAGNFGIPLATFAFGPAGARVMAVVMTVQNFLTFLAGIPLFESRKRSGLSLLWALARNPVILAIVAAFSLRGLGLRLPVQADTAMRYLAGGLIPIALLTLGVQLNRNKGGSQASSLALLTTMRLAISPCIAFGLVKLLPVSPAVGAVLIAAAGLPMAVNVYILSVQYGQNEDLASRGVFVSTLLSAVTLSILLVLLGAPA